MTCEAPRGRYRLDAVVDDWLSSCLPCETLIQCGSELLVNPATSSHIWAVYVHSRNSHGPRSFTCGHMLHPQSTASCTCKDKTVHKSFGGVGSPLNSHWGHSAAIEPIWCGMCGGNLASGMALVVDYWESRHLNWLDGVGCGGGEEYCIPAI